jgi:hypothetical protein
MADSLARKIAQGARFGSWLVIREFESNGRYSRWLCECDCGRRLAVRSALLLNGGSQKCDWCARARGSKLAHGHARYEVKSPEYHAWQGMVSRCTRQSDISYPNYGGRGIKVHPAWCGVGGFRRFLSDVGAKPGPGYSLDRIDVNGDYTPENVRWATREVQVRNKRVNHLLTVGDRTQCLTDWCRETGVSWNTVTRRLAQGVSPEVAVRPGRIK